MNNTDTEIKYVVEPTDKEELKEVEKSHYVDNEEMLTKYIEYQASRKKAIDEGRPEPELTRYLCECILKICTRTAFKYNFINYSFRDDMIGDAIENCFRGFNLFDPSRSKYIFSYFTTAAWRSFIRRIVNEDKETQAKGVMINEMDIDSLILQEHDNEDFKADFLEYMKEVSTFKVKEKRKKESKTNDENYNELVFDEDDNEKHSQE